jgi:hypothetical protein
MRRKTWKTLYAALIALSLISFTSACALLGPKVEMESYETSDGAIVVEAVELVATVTAIDGRARTLTIDPKYSEEQVVKVGPEMANFDQIRVGDEVHAELIEEIAIVLIPGGVAESAGELDYVSLAPLGDKPAITVASSREVTADIIAIDAHAHSVTLELIDGSTYSVKVGKHIDLTTIALGDSVLIQITDAVLIAVEKK